MSLGFLRPDACKPPDARGRWLARFLKMLRRMLRVTRAARVACVTLRLGIGLVALVTAAACGDGGGDDGGDGGDGDDGGDGGGPGEPAEGQFQVFESEFGEDGSAWARVRASIIDPRPVYHRLEQESGACRLWTYEVGDCSGCDGLCNADGECIPLPVELSAGTLTISGLAEGLVVPFTEFGYDPSNDLPVDLFGDGDRVTLEAAGGADVRAFSLEVDSPPRVAIDLEAGGKGIDDSLRLEDGEDLVVSWSPAVPGTRVRLEILSNNRGHGLPVDVMIECEADDSGELVVARELVEAFPDHPYATICVGSDCPPSTLTRFRSDRTSIDGRDVELVVAAQQEFIVVHETR